MQLAFYGELELSHFYYLSCLGRYSNRGPRLKSIKKYLSQWNERTCGFQYIHFPSLIISNSTWSMGLKWNKKNGNILHHKDMNNFSFHVGTSRLVVGCRKSPLRAPILIIVCDLNIHLSIMLIRFFHQSFSSNLFLLYYKKKAKKTLSSLNFSHFFT